MLRRLPGRHLIVGAANILSTDSLVFALQFDWIVDQVNNISKHDVHADSCHPASAIYAPARSAPNE